MTIGRHLVTPRFPFASTTMASSTSPAGIRPSASSPNPTPSSPTGSRSAPRAPTNALALDDDEGEAEEEDEAGGRKRRRPRTQGTDVPLVKDAVGESVVEAFEKFLKT